MPEPSPNTQDDARPAEPTTPAPRKPFHPPAVQELGALKELTREFGGSL